MTAENFSRAGQAVVRQVAAIGQTFFVYNPWVGLIGIVVLAVAAPHLAIGGAVASVIARFTAERVGASRAFLGTGLAELNGWFIGLACATFFAVGPGLVVSLLVGGSLGAALSIVMHRVLATWGVPVFISPYLPAFWLLWSSLPSFPWGAVATLPLVPPASASPLLFVLLGGLRGVGQIFFLPDAAVGVGLAVAASIADRRLGPAMVAASTAAVGIGYLGGVPGWQVEQGLAGFTAALVAAAALRGFAGIGWAAVAVTIVTSPFLEVAALRLAGPLGLPALSAAYIGLVWMFALLRPVRESGAARSGWSTGTRPRLFEDV